MPFAFVLVFVIIALSGWYQSDTEHQRVEAKQTSEAQAVVANMINYYQYIYAHAKVRDASGEMPNLRNVRNHTNPDDFIRVSRANGYVPDAMDWFEGAMVGVTATIEDGVIKVKYEQVAPQYPPTRGVRSEIVRVTNSSPTLKKVLDH